MLCDDLEGWDGGGGRDAQEAGNMADSHYYTAETNTKLQSNYPSVKKKKSTLPTAGCMGLIPDWGIKTPHAAWCSRKQKGDVN